MFDINNKVKLIIDGTLSAKENMARDEVLFKTSQPTFRVYDWEKSYTFGMSQQLNEIENKKEVEAFNGNCAKRITGGGILFHGHDISYSLVIPVSYMKTLNVKQSYEKICSFLLDFYKNIGLNAIYAKDYENNILSKSEFCQVGFEAYDILIDGKKIGGNAQRRTKNIIFQHGSIAITSLDDTVQSGNSLEDFGIKISINEAKEKLIDSFKNTFNVSLQECKLENTI